MTDDPAETLLEPGLATGIGSLPHTDPRRAAELVLDVHPRLPAAPQLPRRSAGEQMLAQVGVLLPEVEVAPDGAVRLRPDGGAAGGEPRPELPPGHHDGLRAFLAVAAARPDPPTRVKVQTVGPLTLGTALWRAGLAAERAFVRAGEAVRAAVRAIEELVAATVGPVGLCCVLDEPVLARWPAVGEPLPREQAIDLLSGVLASVRGVTGVHVCGEGDVRLAFEAGPKVLAVPATGHLLRYADTVARHLDAGGWIAWGAVPTDRPIGEGPDVLWRKLVTLWCELTRRGADPRAVRTQAIITPACGLAGHGPSQAARALGLCRTLADRVGDQAVATRLTVGA